MIDSVKTNPLKRFKLKNEKLYRLAQILIRSSLKQRIVDLFCILGLGLVFMFGFIMSLITIDVIDTWWTIPSMMILTVFAILAWRLIQRLEQSFV